MAANNERVNDSNGHLRSEVLQLAEIINKLNNTNHHLQNDLTEMNSTKQRIEVNLTASAGKVLSLKKLFEEERMYLGHFFTMHFHVLVEHHNKLSYTTL